MRGKGSRLFGKNVLRCVAVLLMLMLCLTGCGKEGHQEETTTEMVEIESSEDGSSREETEDIRQEETTEDMLETQEQTEAETEDETEAETEIGQHVHEFGEWTVLEKSTKYQAGLKERMCLYCEYAEQRRIAAGHHEYDTETGICVEEGCVDGDPEYFTAQWFEDGTLLGHPLAETAKELMLPGTIADETVSAIGFSASLLSAGSSSSAMREARV